MWRKSSSLKLWVNFQPRCTVRKFCSDVRGRSKEGRSLVRGSFTKTNEGFSKATTTIKKKVVWKVGWSHQGGLSSGIPPHALQLHRHRYYLWKYSYSKVNHIHCCLCFSSCPLIFSIMIVLCLVVFYDLLTFLKDTFVFWWPAFYSNTVYLLPRRCGYSIPVQWAFIDLRQIKGNLCESVYLLCVAFSPSACRSCILLCLHTFNSFCLCIWFPGWQWPHQRIS